MLFFVDDQAQTEIERQLSNHLMLKASTHNPTGLS